MKVASYKAASQLAAWYRCSQQFPVPRLPQTPSPPSLSFLPPSLSFLPRLHDAEVLVSFSPAVAV